MDADGNRRTIERLLEVIDAGRVEEMDDLFHDDAVMEWPQSGERVVGADNRRAIYSRFPSLPAVQPRRVHCSGDLCVAEATLTYDGGRRLQCGLRVRYARRQDREGDRLLGVPVRSAGVARRMGRANRRRLSVRVAALYDVHGNLPALEAVLAEAEREGVDRVVFGGDFVTGPMPAESLDRDHLARRSRGRAARQRRPRGRFGRARGARRRRVAWPAGRVVDRTARACGTSMRSTRCRRR